MLSNTEYFAELLNLISLNHYAGKLKHKNGNLKAEVFPYSEIPHFGLCTTKGQTVVFDLSTNVTCSKDWHC